MLAEQIISVTDLRTNTTEVIKSLSQGRKYIFSNNRPKAVILSNEEFEMYEKMIKINEMKLDTEKSEKKGKRFANADDAIDYLLN